MDEIREFVGSAPSLALIIIYMMMLGADDGLRTKWLRRWREGETDKGAFVVSQIIGFVFLALPQFYILVVLVGRIFSQEWH